MPIVKIGDRRRSVETHENKGPANREPAAFGGSYRSDDLCALRLASRTPTGQSALVPAKLPSPAELRSSLVDNLHFEDDQGLWEIVWSLNTVSPDVALNDKIELARAVVFGLLQDGLIELRKVVWPEHDGPLLSSDQIARLHHDDLPWFDPENSTELLVQVSERSA